MNRQVLVIGTTVLLVLCWSASRIETQAAQSEAVLDADAILERLKQLEGTWHPPFLIRN